MMVSQNWLEEKRSAYLYRVMALHESDADIRELFQDLAAESEKQAKIWSDEPAGQRSSIPYIYRPDLRTRIVAFLIRQFGSLKVRPVLAAMKVRGLSVYDALPNHQGAAIDIETRHASSNNSGSFRAAIFGINDGLISIACLVMGVAGATDAPNIIWLTGLAGLLGGAFSMAAGEYVSVRSQREMFEYQIGLEKAELLQYPEEEAQELARIYRARGLPQDEAESLAYKMVSNPEVGLKVLAREELGLNPDDLGSPWMSAISSFVAFSVGGLVPLLPYILGLQSYQLPMAIILTCGVLFIVGLLLSLFTGRRALAGALRMLLIGVSAGSFTYLLGYWFGQTVV